MENIEETMNKLNEKLAEVRSAKKELDQARALAAAPVKEDRSAERAKFYSDIQTSMKENRTVHVNGTGTVNVANELVYALEDKDDLLNAFSIHAGASASNVIPVWNNSIGEFAPVAEDGTFTSEGDGLASVTVEPKAFAKSIKVSDETLKLSAVEFESALNKILTDATRRTILKGIFNGVEGRFVAIDANATAVEVAALNPSAMQKLALTVLAKTDSAKIYMNPADYAAIVDAGTKKDEILLKQIIESKSIEGVPVILSAFVPAGKVIAGDPANYGIGVANEMEITPKSTVGSLAHTYDASIYTAGKPIVGGDFFVLSIGA
jgi:HK97 family phage major capsid protein